MKRVKSDTISESRIIGMEGRSFHVILFTDHSAVVREVGPGYDPAPARAHAASLVH